MNYFPNTDEEINLLKFVSKYQYINTNDVKYFFDSNKYYKRRISNLVSKKLLRRTNKYLVLGELGIEYAKTFNFEYSNLNRNIKYKQRIYYLSNLAAFYNNSKTLKFTPSFCIKDKQVFTTTARRFIGILDINGIEYLTYCINKEHDNKYIKNVLYDIQKEKQYKNIILLVNDTNRISINDFTFGLNQVLIVKDDEENRVKLQYLNSVNWNKIIQKVYKNKVVLSEYSFCDYTDYKNRYVSYFYFLDTEKINRIKYFLRENKYKNADIICTEELKEKLQKELPTAHYIVVDVEEYIDKKRNVYD